MADKIFCTKCGVELPAGASFCSKCGAVVAGSEAEKQQVSEMQAMVKESSFMWVKFLLIIYAIPIIVAAIITLVNADANANAVYNEGVRLYGSQYMIDHNYTVSAIKSYIITGGILAIISGGCTAVSLACVHLKKYWIVAFICCIVATVTAVWSIIGIFVGIFVCWMIYDLKPYFDEEQAAAASSEL